MSMYLGRGLLQKIPFAFSGKVAVVADMAVEELGREIARQLQGILFVLPPKKTKEAWESIHNWLFEQGCGRDTFLVALGGGTLCDLVGFAAATFMRGIPLVLIPTTLLAIVDASIGGKTAIDTPWGKNSIGSFYLPKAVIADLDTLKTLPTEEWMHGISEILKMGLIFDPLIWELYCDRNSQNLSGHSISQQDGQSEALIHRAVEAKRAIVAQDPMEQGLRRILNFGHTIGHGLEKIGQMPHGKAVALGCLAESYLSMQLGFLSRQDFEKIQIPYRNFSLQLPKEYTREAVHRAMQHDKKKEGGHIRFVLIDQIGHALPFEGAYCRHVAPKDLEETLQWLEMSYG